MSAVAGGAGAGGALLLAVLLFVCYRGGMFGGVRSSSTQDSESRSSDNTTKSVGSSTAGKHSTENPLHNRGSWSRSSDLSRSSSAADSDEGKLGQPLDSPAILAKSPRTPTYHSRFSKRMTKPCASKSGSAGIGSDGVPIELEDLSEGRKVGSTGGAVTAGTDSPSPAIAAEPERIKFMANPLARARSALRKSMLAAATAITAEFGHGKATASTSSVVAAAAVSSPVVGTANSAASGEAASPQEPHRAASLAAAIPATDVSGAQNNAPAFSSANNDNAFVLPAARPRRAAGFTQLPAQLPQVTDKARRRILRSTSPKGSSDAGYA